MSDIEFSEHLLAKARKEGDKKLEAGSLGSLGNIYAVQGNIRKGIKYLEESKKISEDLHDWDDVALTCQHLAGCYELGLDDLATAEKYMEMAANLASPSNPRKKRYQAMLDNMRTRLKSMRG